MVVPDVLINLSYDKINSKIAHSLDTLSGERAFFISFYFILFLFCVGDTLQTENIADS